MKEFFVMRIEVLAITFLEARAPVSGGKLSVNGDEMNPETGLDRTYIGAVEAHVAIGVYFERLHRSMTRRRNRNFDVSASAELRGSC